MMATPREATKTLGWILGIALVAGCAGNPAEPVGESGSSLELAGVSALPPVAQEDWADAAAGCEGLLAGDESFGVTRPDGLVVAAGSDGPLCVDTLAATLVELEQLGRNEQAEKLRVGYYASFDDRHLVATSGSGTGEGEPNPQPNIGADGYDPLGALDPSPTAGPGDGEPNPQPNMGPSEGEPNPQPNRPAMTTGTASSSSSSTSGDVGGDTESAGAAAVGGVAGTTSS